MLEHLDKEDPEIAGAIRGEIGRQKDGLEMIASENIVSSAVLEALGTPLTNKYSEGYPGRRYYGGNAFVDVIETLAIERAKRLFGAEHANVQPHSGSTANAEAYFALAELGDTILAMDLAHGGHLTHGSAVNFSGRFYKMVHYGVAKDTELIDMDQVRAIALREKPRVIVAGFTAYSRHLDFAAFRAIAEEAGAYLMVDMAHFAGLVAAKLHPDPVPHADVVTSTTHKTLRGPRGAMILSKTADRLRPNDKKNLAQRIDSAVFPGMQGGPLDHVIAAKAVAFKEASEPAFVDHQRRTIDNARALAEALSAEGLRIVTGGTDNHLVLADLSPLGVSGKQAEAALDEVGICTNKNMIPFDPRKPMDPSGLRLGTPALTTRGCDEGDMCLIASLIGRVLKSPGDAATKTDVSRSVRELAARRPIYPELK
ncbi:MAG TPA: serine hydroxymethyltransferase [Candidatus Eisenbacteria bacterium]|nr:serine hydroxymethyltransferase [Candidatus Eisenbacteria bacterium]